MIDLTTVQEVAASPTALTIIGAVTAGCVTLGMGGLKLAEVAIKKMRGGEGSMAMVRLEPMIANKIHDMARNCTDCKDWRSVTDDDGSPMAFSPRRWGDHLHDIKNAMQGVSGTMEALSVKQDQTNNLLKEIRDGLMRQREGDDRHRRG